MTGIFDKHLPHVDNCNVLEHLTFKNIGHCPFPHNAEEPPTFCLYFKPRLAVA